MIFLLDTNACIHILRKPRSIVADKFFAVPSSEVAISIVNTSIDDVIYSCELNGTVEKRRTA